LIKRSRSVVNSAVRQEERFGAAARRDGPTAKTDERYWRQDKMPARFAQFEDNFRLETDGRVATDAPGAGRIARKAPPAPSPLP
jgi:hypothetical protein